MELVVARMQTIRTANTYVDSNGDTVNFETDIGAKVEDSRSNWDEGDDLTDGAMSIFQGTSTPVPEESDDEQVYVTRKLPMMMRSTVKRGTPAEGAALIRKVNKDIFAAIKSDMKWRTEADEPLAIRTEEVSSGPEYAENSFEITGLQVAIEIYYRTRYFTMD